MESVFFAIATFLQSIDLQNCRAVNREWRKMVDRPEIWAIVSKRDLFTRVTTIRDYQRLDWTSVYRWEMFSNAWFDGWQSLKLTNRNGCSDHIISAILNHIRANVIQVEKLRRWQQGPYGNSMDGRIALQKRIEDLISQSEELEQDLYRYVSFYLPKDQIDRLRYK